MTTAGKAKGPVTLTREELHRRVWETPISRLGPEFGITGNGLAKICDRLAIPYPPRGYWAKKAAGGRVIAKNLPPARGDIPDRVTITPTPPRPAAPEMPAELAADLAAVKADLVAVTVPERLSHPHPIIAGWQAAQQGWKRSELDRRRFRLLDALFKALERRRAKLKEPVRYQVAVEVGGEAVEFQLREGEKQVRRPLTAEEKAQPYANKSGFRQERLPTGRLVFTIKTWLPGNLPTQWKESEAVPMEVLLPEIAAVILAAGPLLAERRRQREEAEHQRRLAEHQRWEEQQRQKRDDNRWRRLVDIAEQRHEAELVRDLLAALSLSPADPATMLGGQSLAAWLAWAAERVRQADPLTHGTEAVFRSVASVTEYTYRPRE